MAMILNQVSQLHTIISREIIKPSSPTPSNLKTYNLSSIDQSFDFPFIPMVLFYPNTTIYHGSHDKALELKNSLSQTLTKYYPLAGRYNKVAPKYVECNDMGAEFFEASMDCTLSDFLQNSQHQDLNQLFPHNLNYKGHHLQSDKVIPLMVQINHFECGGVAIAVSMTHKIADGSSITHFINDWAKMTRFEEFQLPIDPLFIPFEYTDITFSARSPERSNDCVTKSFTFPNSKINDLKRNCFASLNPTRVEVLSGLLYKCAVVAATRTMIFGSFKPTSVCHAANIRRKMMEPLPEKSIGNFIVLVEIVTKNESDMKLESFISEFKKQKVQLESLRNIEGVFSLLSKNNSAEIEGKLESGYSFSSLCGFPTYEIDFGWGKPVRATTPGYTWKNCVVLMDAPNKDGIEAIVSLGKQDMAIFESDPELLALIS